MIVRHDNFLNPDDCAKLRLVYDEKAPNVSERDYSGFPVVRHHDFVITSAYEVLQKVTIGVITELEKNGIIGQYPETVLMTGLGIGGHHILHADNCKLDGDTWVPNHTPYRTYTCMQYLNSDFDGGEISWPTQNMTIKPTEGMLVAFPSDHLYAHEVHPVTRGKRYAVAIWMTNFSARQLQF